MPRHSFIQMTKLHNVMGRIDYITSTVKQENLYAIYATQPLRSFWKDLAKCNREEFAKSGTIGKYIEARELIIALPEGLYHYEHDYLIKHFATDFKKKYGVDCYAALHHNKRKTNFHIHLIFAERTKLEKPVVKVASRNMFYDERGKHVRTKKEILDASGDIRNGCKIIRKGEVYEKKEFSIKVDRFKKDSFLDEAKVFFTNEINQLVLHEEDKLKVFDKNSPYLATKKIGKNNPMEEQIKADNEVRQEWNRTVDRAIVSGVSEEDISRIKKNEITEKVRYSIDLYGDRPDLLASIIKLAIAVLELLINRIMLAAVGVAEKMLERVVDQPLILLDGAHNAAGADALCHAVDELLKMKRLHVVMGMVRDKDYETCVHEVASRADDFYACVPDAGERSLDVHTIAELARQSCKRVYECESAEHAIELALEHAKMNDCILICGSLYLIGECEKILRGRPKATD